MNLVTRSGDEAVLRDGTSRTVANTSDLEAFERFVGAMESLLLARRASPVTKLFFETEVPSNIVWYRSEERWCAENAISRRCKEKPK